MINGNARHAPSVHRPDVFREVRERGVAQVAEALGLAVKGKTVACPACRTKARGDHDFRLPANITPGGNGWRCHRCGEGGGAVEFLAYVALGRRLRRGDRADLEQAARAARELFSGNRIPPSVLRIRPASPARPRRIFVDEALHLLRTLPPTEVPEVAAFLRSQGISPDRVEALDLVRVLHPKATLWPLGAVLPDGTPWVCSRYRMLLRAFNARGRLAALVAWEIGGDTTFPAPGHTGEGLYLMNGPARQARAGNVVVGVRAFLAAATMENAGPVIGVFDEK